jgi:hypothetical protein
MKGQSASRIALLVAGLALWPGLAAQAGNSGFEVLSASGVSATPAAGLPDPVQTGGIPKMGGAGAFAALRGAVEPFPVLAGAPAAATFAPDLDRDGTLLCVRQCDGFYFPVPGETSAGASPLDLCRAACPGAELTLFRRSGPGMRDARGEHGERYGDLVRAFRYRVSAAPACGCSGGSRPWSDRILRDPTLRRGDVVVTPEGARAFVGTSGIWSPRRSDFVDIRERGAVSPSLQREAGRLTGPWPRSGAPLGPDASASTPANSPPTQSSTEPNAGRPRIVLETPYNR